MTTINIRIATPAITGIMTEVTGRPVLVFGNVVFGNVVFGNVVIDGEFVFSTVVLSIKNKDRRSY